jgi:hypothetical protein
MLLTDPESARSIKLESIIVYESILWKL